MKKTYFISAIISTLLLSSCGSGIIYNPPTQLISQEKAKNLNLKYINERSNLITQNLNVEDANAIWYSIEELENYLHYVKKEGKEKGIEVTGIRFYLGVYPNDIPNYQEKAGMTTIFLSPTKKNARNKQELRSEKTNKQTNRTEENIDAVEISPLNFGGMGNPPKIEYGE
ncbi:MAG: hypothetical protein KBC56_03420 [Flavobacterium sp.]|nr:hypothetical protein [Flavobacterium sp.]